MYKKTTNQQYQIDLTISITKLLTVNKNVITITDILKESAKTNVGYIERSKRSENVDIIMLSDMQQNVQKQIESPTNEETIYRLKIKS